MKIIGKTDNGYIAELTEGDLGAILGETWLDSDAAKAMLEGLGLMASGPYNARVPKFVGATIPISERFRRAVDIEYKAGECSRAAGTLRGLADLLEKTSQMPIIPAMKEGA